MHIFHFTHKCVTRQRPWHKYDSMFHFYILLGRERSSHRVYVTVHAYFYAPRTYIFKLIQFIFFRGRISALASTLNTFFLLLNLNEFQRFFARERESKFQLEGERETMPQCEWRGNISYFAVDSLQFIFSLNSSVSPEQIKHRWRCLYDQERQGYDMTRN